MYKLCHIHLVWDIIKYRHMLVLVFCCYLYCFFVWFIMIRRTFIPTMVKIYSFDPITKYQSHSKCIDVFDLFPRLADLYTLVQTYDRLITGKSLLPFYHNKITYMYALLGNHLHVFITKFISYA